MVISAELTSRIKACLPEDYKSAMCIVRDLQVAIDNNHIEIRKRATIESCNKPLTKDTTLSTKEQDYSSISNCESLLSFLKYAYYIKETPRTGWHRIGVQGQKETVACHMYRLALMAAVLAPQFTQLGIDPAKAVCIALVHDLAEAIVGDITPDCGVPPEEKRNRETDAMRTICAHIPDCEVLNWWLEYDENTTSTSKFVHDLDKLEFALQAAEYLPREPREQQNVLCEFVRKGCARVQGEHFAELVATILKHTNIDTILPAEPSPISGTSLSQTN